jgi:protein ImuB
MGPGSVRVPEWRGGRDPGECLALVPCVRRAGDGSDVSAPAVLAATDGPPWPGALPGPLPAAVHVDPVSVEVRDASGQMVAVDGRGVLSAPPHLLSSPPGPGGSAARGAGDRVVAWAGPWPLDERWWDPERRRRSARLQVVTADGAARLVVLEGGVWRVAATYD